MKPLAKPRSARAPERDRTLRPSTRRVIARGLVVRALRSAGMHHVVDRRGSLTVLAGVAAEDVTAVSEGIVALLRSRGWNVSYGRDVVHDFVTARSASSTRRDGTALVESDNGIEPEFVLVDDVASVPPLLAAASDGVAVLGTIDAALVGAAFKAVLGGTPGSADLKLAATLPLHRLPLAIRRGRPVAEAMAVIRKLAALEPAAGDPALGTGDAAKAVPSAGPGLEDMHGLGEAGDWGRALVADLAEYGEGRLPWADMDRGALLVGPPGVGKTMFAGALAASAGVPLYAHSLARWQARGHLGDLLKAMYADSTRPGGMPPASCSWTNSTPSARVTTPAIATPPTRGR